MSEACKDEQRRQSRPVDLGGDGKTYRTVQDDIDTWRNISPESLERQKPFVKVKITEKVLVGNNSLSLETGKILLPYQKLS